MALREYQKTPVQMAIDYFRMPQDVAQPSLIVLPTAWGKSWLVAYVARSIPDGEKLLVLQPSKELLEQNYEKYVSLCGDLADAGVYSAAMRKKNVGKITFATIGSIKQLGKAFKELGFTKLLIDEAHMYPRKEESMIGRFISDSGIRQVLGITATPIKMESFSFTKTKVVKDENGNPVLDDYGRPVTKKMYGGYSKQVILTNPSKDGVFYSDILYVGQIREMVDYGAWSKLLYDKQPYDPEKLRFNSDGDEYTKKSVEDAYTSNGVHDRILKALKYYRERKHCVVFVPSVDEARKLAGEAENAAYVCGQTPRAERSDIINRFRSGDIRVVFNVGILSTGFDYPLIDMIIMAFSTASIAKYYQALGRGVRVHPEKENCLIVDMCGNLDRFGHIESLRYMKDDIWRLVGFHGNILTGIPISVIGCYNIEDLARIRSTNHFLEVLPFGKYKDVNISEVPSDYLLWMLAKVSDDPERQQLADALRYHLENEVRDTTGEPPLERMPYGIHQGKPLSECPKGYLSWLLESVKWTEYNDSLRRGVEQALDAPSGLLFEM